MEVRRRNVAKLPIEALPVQLIESFDVFPKLPDDCKKPTSTGGAITLFTVLASVLLIFSEVRNYVYPQYVYTYEVDHDFESKVKINVDITVATKCEFTSLDLLDVTGSTVDSNEMVRYRKAAFELSSDRRKRFELKRRFTNIMRSQYHVVSDAVRNAKSTNWFSDFYGDDSESLVKQYDACRISGTVHVRKVAGNIHLIPGKPLPGVGGAHLHIAPLLNLDAFNFSHRIDHLSFGEPVANRLNALDAVEHISLTPMETFQYYVSIVPTRIVHAFSTLETYQYAVTIKNRTINHAEGSHGMPGIFLTYETFPLLVQVAESRELFGTFLARLAALIGGLFATIGLLRQALCGLPLVFLDTHTGRRLQSCWTQFQRQYGKDVPPEGLLNPDSAT